MAKAPRAPKGPSLVELKTQLAEKEAEHTRLLDANLGVQAQELLPQLAELREAIAKAEQEAKEQESSGDRPDHPLLGYAANLGIQLSAADRKKVNELHAQSVRAEAEGDYERAIELRQKVREASQVPLPTRIKMVKPHGFIGGDGQPYHWNAGQEIASPSVIALLVARCPRDVEDISPKD